MHIHVYRSDIHVYCRADIITPCACARGKVISSVVVIVVVVVDTKSPDLNIEAPERLVSMPNVANVAKTGFSVLRIEWHDLQVSQIVHFSWSS